MERASELLDLRTVDCAIPFLGLEVDDIKALLQGRRIFTPGPEGYSFAGDGTLTPIITGLVPKGSGTRARTLRAIDGWWRIAAVPNQHTAVTT